MLLRRWWYSAPKSCLTHHYSKHHLDKINYVSFVLHNFIREHVKIRDLKKSCVIISLQVTSSSPFLCVIVEKNLCRVSWLISCVVSVGRCLIFYYFLFATRTNEALCDNACFEHAQESISFFLDWRLLQPQPSFHVLYIIFTFMIKFQLSSVIYLTKLAIYLLFWINSFFLFFQTPGQNACNLKSVYIWFYLTIVSP